MLANAPTTEPDTQSVLNEYMFQDIHLGGKQSGNNTENLTSKS